MPTTETAQQFAAAWAQQRIWSQVANRPELRIGRPRFSAFLLAIGTAVLAVAADRIGGLSAAAGRWRRTSRIPSGRANTDVDRLLSARGA